jgi:conjugative transfer signal peptidase TraF
MTRRDAIVVATLGSVGLVTTSMWSKHPPRYVWNASASVPVGLYRVEAAETIDVGDLAIVIPPEPLADFLGARGYLPKGVPMLKRVLALSGTAVCRQGSDIIAYGMTYGRARERDSYGRSLPTWQGCRAVPDDQAFLMNWDSADSFDSRYFGPLPVTWIVGRAVPAWTFDRTDSAADHPNKSRSDDP